MFDSEDTPGFYDTTSYCSPIGIEELSLIDEKYVVVGENHPDEKIAEKVIIPLLNSGEFDTILLEAFINGPVGNPPRQEYSYFKDGVYVWNPEKFDRITEEAIENGVDVYGLESRGERKKTEREELANWALETVKKTDEKTLIVVGTSHTCAPEYIETPMRKDFRKEATLEHMLPEESATVALAGSDDFKANVQPLQMEEGLYRTEDIPRFMPGKFSEDDRKNFVFVELD